MLCPFCHPAQGFLERVMVVLFPPKPPKKVCVQSPLGRKLVSTKLRGTRYTILGLLKTRVFVLGEKMGLEDLH